MASRLPQAGPRQRTAGPDIRCPMSYAFCLLGARNPQCQGLDVSCFPWYQRQVSGTLRCVGFSFGGVMAPAGTILCLRNVTLRNLALGFGLILLFSENSWNKLLRFWRKLLPFKIRILRFLGFGPNLPPPHKIGVASSIWAKIANFGEVWLGFGQFPWILGMRLDC